MSLQSGGSPVWWRSCPETTHPGGFISLCPFLPPTRCLDVLLWAGTLAESAVHLCKWPLQHPSHLFDLIATVELFGGVWIYRILLQKNCWWCIHIYIQGCHSYVQAWQNYCLQAAVSVTLATCYLLLSCSFLSDSEFSPGLHFNRWWKCQTAQRIDSSTGLNSTVPKDGMSGNG